MTSRILFIIFAAVALMGGQSFLVAPGTSIVDPVFACLLTLIISPWLYRQFE